MPSISSVGCYADSEACRLYGCYGCCIGKILRLHLFRMTIQMTRCSKGYGKIKIPFDSNLSFGTNGNYWDNIVGYESEESLTVRHASLYKEDFDPTFFEGS